MTQETLKLALDALESKYIVNCGAWRVQQNQAITAIKEALAKEKALQALHNENERLGLYKDAYAEQETVGYWKEHAQGMQRDYDSLLADYEKLAQTEHNFCPRCGKRNKDIHTCTPPQEKNT